MLKLRLTDRKILSLKPQKNARGVIKQFDIADSDTPGLCLRVGKSGTKTFVLLARFPGSKNPPDANWAITPLCH